MQLRPVGVFCVAVLLSSPIFSLAQLFFNPQNTPLDLKSGIVVEKLAEHAQAGKAGMREGDVLHRWRRGDAQGEIGSPFDLASVEIEQAPRGEVMIEGLRSGVSKVWRLGPDEWGIEARPDLAEPLLRAYGEGRDLAAGGKPSEASEKWRAIAGQADPFTAQWLFFKIGQTLADARHWQEADAAFQEAIHVASSAEPELQAQLLRVRGKTFEQRSMWAEAEKDYREALSKDTESGDHRLASTLDLRNLGFVAMSRSDFSSGQKYYENALDERRKLAPESLAVATSLLDLCKVADVRSEPGRVEDYCNRALQLATRLAPGGLLSARILNTRGAAAYHHTNLGKAEEDARRALETLDELAPGSLDIAASYTTLADVASTRGDWAKTEEYDQRTLEIREKLAPDSLAVATSLNNIANHALGRGNLAKAEEYYHRALELREKLAPDSPDVAASLYGLGTVCYRSGDLGKAEEYQGRALEIREKLLPSSAEVAQSQEAMANLANQRGDLDKAEECHRKALEIRERLAPGSLRVGQSLHNLGIVTRKRGDLAKAEVLLLQARDIYEKVVPGSLTVAALLNSLGALADNQNDLLKAEEYYQQSLKIRQALAPGSTEVAEALSNLGMVALKDGDFAKAEDYLQHAQDIEARLAPDSLWLAYTLNNLGDTAWHRGDLEKAEQYATRAMAIREKLAPISVDLGESLNSLGGIAQQRGDLEKSEQYYRRALAIWEKLAPETGSEAKALAGLANIMRRRGQLDAAAELYGQALNALESQANRLGGTEDVRSGFRAKYENYYQEYASLLVEQGKSEVAFQVLERSRARSLLEMLASAHLAIRRGADAALLQREHSLAENLSAKSDRRVRLLSSSHSDAQIVELDNEISHLREEHQSVEAKIRAGSPAYAALTQPEPLTALEVRGLLDADTVLLEYSLGQEHSYVFTVTPQSVDYHELPKRDDIEHLARSVYDALTSRNRVKKGETPPRRQARWEQAERAYTSLSLQLSKMVLGPVAAEIQGKRLLIVSDGALQYVPFAALPEPSNTPSAQTPLMMAHEVVNLPSASVLAVLRRQDKEKKPAPKLVAVLADPVFSRRDPRLTKTFGLRPPEENRGSPKLETRSSGSDSSSVVNAALTRSVRDVGLLELSRLPFTRLEAQTIMSLTPPGQAMEALDFQAARATATSADLAQYRIVHFATHGLLDNQHPELSGLVLSLLDRAGKTREGFLSLEDIYNLNLPAELVVLSACETALGKEISGEGLIGLTRGFMYAGASRVMASLWSVNDAGTAELMAGFYQGVLHDGMRPAAALRQAQLQMRKTARWKSPYYWAAFQIQGDWK